MCDKTGNLECQLYNSLPHLLNLVILKLCKKVVDESPIGQCDRKLIYSTLKWVKVPMVGGGGQGDMHNQKINVY